MTSPYTVRIYGHDWNAGREVLLEEHPFTDPVEARAFERVAVREGRGLVTYGSGDKPARTFVRDAELRVYNASPGTDDASDMYVMEVLGVTIRVRLVAGQDGPTVTVEGDDFTIADA